MARTRILPILLLCVGMPAYAQRGPAGTLVVAAPTDLANMNSLVNNEAWTSEVIRNVLFLPLVRFNADMSYAPALAQSWQFSGDTLITFKLRRDVKWHDGPRTTAYDVAFTFDRAKDAATAFPERYFDRWQSAQVLDSFTVRFRLLPQVDPLLGWAQTAIMPKHLLDSIPPNRLRQTAFNKQPVGNGPYRFVSQQANDRWVFEANPEFPRALGGRPAINRIVWRIMPDNNAQQIALSTGEIDVALGLRAEQAKQLAARGFRVIMRPSNQYAAVMWNSKRPALSDARVRRALTMALNRQQIIDVMRAGYAQVAATPVPPWHWAYDRKVVPPPYDVNAARKLLASAGYSNARPLELELKVPAVQIGRDIGEMIRAGLAAAGAQVTVRPVDYAALLQDVNGARDFDGVFLAASTDFRLDFTDIFHSKSSTAWYSSPQLDRLLDRALVTTNRQQAAPIWHQVQTTIRDAQPWTFVWWAPQIVILSPRVQGVEIDVRGALRGLPSWRLTQR